MAGIFDFMNSGIEDEKLKSLEAMMSGKMGMPNGSIDHTAAALSGMPMPNNMPGMQANNQMNNAPQAMRGVANGPIPNSIIQATQAPSPPPEQPGFFARMGQGFRDYTSDPEKMARAAAAFNTMRLNPDPNVSKMAQDQIARSQGNKSANQTVDFFRKEGRDDLAALVEANPSLAKEVYQEYLKSKFDTVKGESWSKTPQLMQGPAGAMGYFVVSDQGNIKEVQLPEGMGPSKGLSEVDTGTHINQYDFTGRLIASIPKSSAEEERRKAIGKGTGEMTVEALTSAKKGLANSKQMLGTLTSMLGDQRSAVESRVGLIQGRLPAVTEKQALGQSYIDQALGSSFLEAFTMLKGGGQITEVESANAMNALSRLRTLTVGDSDYMRAVKDLHDVAARGVQNLQDEIGQAESASQTAFDSAGTVATPSSPSALPPGVSVRRVN